MTSYAQDVKTELAHVFDDDDNCLRAEFVALMKVGAKKIDGRLEFSTSNAAVARKVITLAKKIFPHIKPEVAAVRLLRLRKNLRYVVRFIMAGELQTFFDELDLNELLKRIRFKIAYLRGAFLAGGSVNRPESSYLLQISTHSIVESGIIRKQIIQLDFKAGIYQRKKDFVIWFPGADAICDFLCMLGANNVIERFEVARNLKEIRALVNRIVNMETASLQKSVDAAQRQIADIKFLLDKKVPVSQKLRETMELRLENPTCTIVELAAKIPMTREGLLYRFRNIRRLAKKFGKK